MCRNRLCSVPIKQPVLKGKGCDDRRTPLLNCYQLAIANPLALREPREGLSLQVMDRWLVATHHGMIFLIPFFLLLDSF